jgi:transposase
MAPRYKVELSREERSRLDGVARKGKSPARAVLGALALLFCDAGPEGRGGKKNREISRELNISERSIETLKKRFLEGGIEKALQMGPGKAAPRKSKFGKAFEEGLAALAASPPPEGRARWPVRLLAEKLKEQGLAPGGVSAMSVQRMLKKMKPGPASGGAGGSRRGQGPETPLP